MPEGDDSHPFEAIRLVRERDDDGTPTGWYTLVGEREDWERHQRVTGAMLFAQTNRHLEFHHESG